MTMQERGNRSANGSGGGPALNADKAEELASEFRPAWDDADEAADAFKPSWETEDAGGDESTRVDHNPPAPEVTSATAVIAPQPVMVVSEPPPPPPAAPPVVATSAAHQLSKATEIGG